MWKIYRNFYNNPWAFPDPIKLVVIIFLDGALDQSLFRKLGPVHEGRYSVIDRLNYPRTNWFQEDACL